MAVWHNRLKGPEQGGGPALVSVKVQKVTGAVVEVGDDVMHESGGMTIRAAGRQTELDRAEPGDLDLALNNSGGDYTPGYPSAPVMLQQGTPVWVRETVGRRSFGLFDGEMSQPEALFLGFPGNAGDRVAVTATDWVGGQQQGRRFISNLGEWILYHGGDTLVEYWPMTESQRPHLPVRDPTSPSVSSRIWSSSAEPADGFGRITPAAGAMPLGEDSQIPVIGGPLDSAGLPAFFYHLGVDYNSVHVPEINIASGQVFTAVVWIQPDLFADLQWLFSVTLSEQPGGLTIGLDVVKPSSGPVELGVPSGALTGTIVGSGMETGRPYPVGIRFGADGTVFEFWQGRKRFTGTLSGTPASSYRFVNCASGIFNYQGSFGHLQLYVGAEADYTFEHYLAQIDHAENALTGGLRWQRTDERIATISRYAGLTDGQMQLDRGASYMARASLAGKTWQQAVQEAVDTEQGRLIWRDEHLVFNNRVNTRYNV